MPFKALDVVVGILFVITLGLYFLWTSDQETETELTPESRAAGTKAQPRRAKTSAGKKRRAPRAAKR